MLWLPHLFPYVNKKLVWGWGESGEKRRERRGRIRRGREGEEGVDRGNRKELQ